MKIIINFCLLLGMGMSTLASPLDMERVVHLEKERRYGEALELCQKADESSATLYLQGDYYYHGRKGVPRDKIRGRGYYRLAMEKLLPEAETENALAQYQLARCHEYGREEMKEAREWYFKAADAGNAQAMHKAAWFAARRIEAQEMEVDEALELSLRYAQSASKAGNPDGKALWAWLTHLVCGDRDFESALPIFMESAKANSLLGKTLLGRMYYEGSGVEQDLEKAEQYLQDAVDQGYSDALETLEAIKKEK